MIVTVRRFRSTWSGLRVQFCSCTVFALLAVDAGSRPSRAICRMSCSLWPSSSAPWGGWVDENTLVVRYVGGQAGEEVIEEIAIDFVAPDRIIGHVIEQVDGAIAITTDLSMTKQT